MEAGEDERVAELRLQIREKYGYKKRDLSRGWDSIGQDFAGVSAPTTRVLSKANNSYAPAFATPVRGGVKNVRNRTLVNRGKKKTTDIRLRNLPRNKCLQDLRRKNK